MATTTRPAAGLMTAEEFCEFACRPENEDRFFELDAGQLVETPMPMILHGVVCSLVGFLLGTHSRRTSFGLVATNNPGVILGRAPDTVRCPDVAYYGDRPSWRELLAEQGCSASRPLLAVEVLSPSDRPDRIARKVAQYHAGGVKLVWVIDPSAREVTVYRSFENLTIFRLDDLLTGGEELPGFECRVAEFFELPGGAAEG